MTDPRVGRIRRSGQVCEYAKKDLWRKVNLMSHVGRLVCAAGTHREVWIELAGVVRSPKYSLTRQKNPVVMEERKEPNSKNETRFSTRISPSGASERAIRVVWHCSQESVWRDSVTNPNPSVLIKRRQKYLHNIDHD